MENEMEREQDYDLANEGDVEFCEPEIVVEDVEFETPSDSIVSIDYILYNLDVSVADTEIDEDDVEFVEAISENECIKNSFPAPNTRKSASQNGRLDETHKLTAS